MASLDILTYDDAVSHCLDVFGVDRGTIPRRQALRAVQRAYSTFPDMHRWSYFERRGQFNTVASQTTGTIAYDHAGGLYERMLTLSDATFPSADDIRIYKIIINQVQYDIEDWKSSTVVTLSATNNPGSDVAAGTAYTLYKSRYLLPINFRKMITPLINLSQADCLLHVSPNELLDHMRGNYQPSDPNVYTIYNAGEYYGGWLVEIAPPPNIAETWEYLYEASPRPLRIERDTTGTVATNGTTTVTGTSTAFTSKMVGSILRVPISGTTEPGGITGNLDASGSTVEPFDEQRTIVAVASTTSLTVDSAITTRAGVKALISDPVDMEPGSMVQAFLAVCEAEFARLNNRKDWKEWQAAMLVAVRHAMSADNRQREMHGVPGRSSRLGAWAIPEAYGGSALS